MTDQDDAAPFKCWRTDRSAKPLEETVTIGPRLKRADPVTLARGRACTRSGLDPRLTFGSSVSQAILPRKSVR
jgi:hypothetical protein